MYLKLVRTREVVHARCLLTSCQTKGIYGAEFTLIIPSLTLVQDQGKTGHNCSRSRVKLHTRFGECPCRQLESNRKPYDDYIARRQEQEAYLDGGYLRYTIRSSNCSSESEQIFDGQPKAHHEKYAENMSRTLSRRCRSCIGREMAMSILYFLLVCHHHFFMHTSINSHARVAISWRPFLQTQAVLTIASAYAVDGSSGHDAIAASSRPP